MPDPITEFQGEHRFLSNFYPSPIPMWNGLIYPTVEHAFQAAKTLSSAQRELIRTAHSPAVAKRLGREVQLRHDWDDMRLRVMRFLVARKFAEGSPLASQLLSTGTRDLIEGNHWGDRFWGVDGAGKNHLGVILMARREQLARTAFIKTTPF